MKNTTENNKLIAEFMGNRFKPLPHTNNECFSLLGSWDVIHITDFETGVYAYHSDWNRLMLVTKKIFEETSHHTLEFEEYLYKVQDGVLQGDIIIVYEAVVKFIKWYNTSAKVLDILNKI